jgi:hypothetical protein
MAYHRFGDRDLCHRLGDMIQRTAYPRICSHGDQRGVVKLSISSQKYPLILVCLYKGVTPDLPYVDMLSLSAKYPRRDILRVLTAPSIIDLIT